MSMPSNLLRDAVVRRARNRCEYCQLPAHLQVGGFEVDHILPRSRGGQTDLANVALACPHCNARKWAYIDGEDPRSSIGADDGAVQPEDTGVGRPFSLAWTAPVRNRGDHSTRASNSGTATDEPPGPCQYPPSIG